MTAPDERRLTPTERLHEVTMAALNRRPAVPESSVTIGVTAKRLHTWEVTVRGENVEDCAALAARLDDELTLRYASEVERGNGGDPATDRSAAQPTW